MVFQDRERQQQNPDEAVNQRRVLQRPLEPARAGEVADLPAERRHQRFVSRLHRQHPHIGHNHHIGPVARSPADGFLLEIPFALRDQLVRRRHVQARPAARMHLVLEREYRTAFRDRARQRAGRFADVLRAAHARYEDLIHAVQ